MGLRRKSREDALQMLFQWDITHDTIEGIGYDAINGDESRFAVEIRTGQSLLPSPASIDGLPLW